MSSINFSAFCEENSFLFKATRTAHFIGNKISDFIHIIDENSKPLQATSSAVTGIWKTYHLFLRDIQNAASAGVQAAGTLTWTTGSLIGASLLQTALAVGSATEGLYKLGRDVQTKNVKSAVYHGLIYVPTKLSLAVTGAMSSTQQIILLQVGHVAPVFGFVGTIGALALSVFNFMNGFYSFFNAHTFSEELTPLVEGAFPKPEENADPEKVNEAKIKLEQFLFRQAFGTEEEFNDLDVPIEWVLRQHREEFIRNTSEECYNDLVKAFFPLHLVDDIPQAKEGKTLKDIYNTLNGAKVINIKEGKSSDPEKNIRIVKTETREITYENIKDISGRDLENLKPVSVVDIQKIYRYNAQVKFIAAIKMVASLLAVGACIALIVGSGGLGILAMAAILLVITAFLKITATAPRFHEEMFNKIWDYQKHRILPAHLVGADTENKRTTSSQVQFAVLATLAALTFPVWSIPTAAIFQTVDALERLFQTKSSFENIRKAELDRRKNASPGELEEFRESPAHSSVREEPAFSKEESRNSSAVGEPLPSDPT